MRCCKQNTEAKFTSNYFTHVSKTDGPHALQRTFGTKTRGNAKTLKIHHEQTMNNNYIGTRQQKTYSI